MSTLWLSLPQRRQCTNIRTGALTNDYGISSSQQMNAHTKKYTGFLTACKSEHAIALQWGVTTPTLGELHHRGGGFKWSKWSCAPAPPVLSGVCVFARKRVRRRTAGHFVDFTNEENHNLWWCWWQVTSINPWLTGRVKVTTAMTAFTTWRALLATHANHTAANTFCRLYGAQSIIRPENTLQMLHYIQAMLHSPLGSCQVDGSCGFAAADSRLWPDAGRPPALAGWWAPHGRIRSPFLLRRRHLSTHTPRPAETQGAQKCTSNRSPKTCSKHSKSLLACRGHCSSFSSSKGGLGNSSGIIQMWCNEKFAIASLCPCEKNENKR